jgi:hypothetical protein
MGRASGVASESMCVAHVKNEFEEMDGACQPCVAQGVVEGVVDFCLVLTHSLTVLTVAHCRHDNDASDTNKAGEAITSDSGSSSDTDICETLSSSPLRHAGDLMLKKRDGWSRAAVARVTAALASGTPVKEAHESIVPTPPAAAPSSAASQASPAAHHQQAPVCGDAVASTSESTDGARDVVGDDGGTRVGSATDLEAPAGPAPPLKHEEGAVLVAVKAGAHIVAEGRREPIEDVVMRDGAGSSCSWYIVPHVIILTVHGVTRSFAPDKVDCAKVEVVQDATGADEAVPNTESAASGANGKLLDEQPQPRPTPPSATPSPPTAVGPSRGNAPTRGSGASRGNKKKSARFARFLVDTFGARHLASGTGVIDVAGGNGELAAELATRYGITTTIIDPDPRPSKRVAKMLGIRSQVRRCRTLDTHTHTLTLTHSHSHSHSHSHTHTHTHTHQTQTRTYTNAQARAHNAHVHPLRSLVHASGWQWLALPRDRRH